MKLEEKKVEFGKLMDVCLTYLTPEESFEKFKELVSLYVRNLEVFSECDINNMSDSEYGDIITRLYKITFFDDDFLTILSDQKGLEFDRIETIMTNMVFEDENIGKYGRKNTVYGHLCYNVAVAEDYNISLKKLYSVDKLIKLERENKIILYSKKIDLYDSMPVAQPRIIESLPLICSMEMFDRFGEEKEITQSFKEEIECTDIYPFFVDYLSLWFSKRKLLVDMKAYMEEFNKQFNKFMEQDNEKVRRCKEWYAKSITKGRLQKLNKNAS